MSNPDPDCKNVNVNVNAFRLINHHARHEEEARGGICRRLGSLCCCFFHSQQQSPLRTNQSVVTLYTSIERSILQLKDRINANDLNRLFLEVFFGITLTLLAIVSSLCMMNWWPSALATFIFPRTVLLLPDVLRFFERAKHICSRDRFRSHSLLSPTEQLNRPLIDAKLLDAFLSCISSFGNILACIGFVYSFFNVSSIQIAEIDEANVIKLPMSLRPPTGDALLFFAPLVLSVVLELFIIILVCICEFLRAKILERRITNLNQTPRDGTNIAYSHLSRSLFLVFASRWFSWFAGIEVALIYVFICSLNASTDSQNSLGDRHSVLATARNVILSALVFGIFICVTIAIFSLILFPVCVKLWMRYIVKAWRHSDTLEIEVESYHRHYRITSARETGIEPLAEDVIEVANERQRHFRPRTESELRLTVLRIYRFKANWWFVMSLFCSSIAVSSCAAYLLSLLYGRALALIDLFKYQLEETNSSSSSGGGGSGRVILKTFRSILDEAAGLDNAVIPGSPFGSSTIKISVTLIVLNGLILGALLVLAHALQSLWAAETQALLGGLSNNNGIDESKPPNGTSESIKQQLPLFLERIHDGVYRRIEEDRIARRSGLLVITNPLHCLIDVRDALDRRRSKKEEEEKEKEKEEEEKETYPSSPRNAPPFTETCATPSATLTPSAILLNAAMVHVKANPLHINTKSIVETSSQQIQTQGRVLTLRDVISSSSHSSTSVSASVTVLSNITSVTTTKSLPPRPYSSSSTSPPPLPPPSKVVSSWLQKDDATSCVISMRTESVHDESKDKSLRRKPSFTLSSGLGHSRGILSSQAIQTQRQQTPRQHDPRPPCYICMETAADSVFLECGHGGVCAVCAGIIMRGKLEMHRASISSNGNGLVLVDDGQDDEDNDIDENNTTFGTALTNAFGGGFGRRTLASAAASRANSRDEGSSSLRWPIYSGGTGVCPMCRSTVTSVVRIGPDVAMTDGRIVALILPHSYWREGTHSPRLVVNGLSDGSKLGLTLTPRTQLATTTMSLDGPLSERFRL